MLSPKQFCICAEFPNSFFDEGNISEGSLSSLLLFAFAHPARKGEIGDSDDVVLGDRIAAADWFILFEFCTFFFLDTAALRLLCGDGVSDSTPSRTK